MMPDTASYLQAFTIYVRAHIEWISYYSCLSKRLYESVRLAMSLVAGFDDLIRLLIVYIDCQMATNDKNNTYCPHVMNREGGCNTHYLSLALDARPSTIKQRSYGTERRLRLPTIGAFV